MRCLLVRLGMVIVASAVLSATSALAQNNTPPMAFDEEISVYLGDVAMHDFEAIDLEDDPTELTWSNLTIDMGSPAVGATLSADGAFEWHTIGSPLGTYIYSATVTDPRMASDVGSLRINVLMIPEPTTATLTCLASLGLVMFRTCRSKKRNGSDPIADSTKRSARSHFI